MKFSQIAAAAIPVTFTWLGEPVTVTLSPGGLNAALLAKIGTLGTLMSPGDKFKPSDFKQFAPLIDSLASILAGVVTSWTVEDDTLEPVGEKDGAPVYPLMPLNKQTLAACPLQFLLKLIEIVTDNLLPDSDEEKKSAKTPPKDLPSPSLPAGKAAKYRTGTRSSRRRNTSASRPGN